MFLWICLLIALSGYMYTRFNRLRRFADKIPGDAPWPIVGNLMDVGTDHVEFVLWMIKIWYKHGMKSFGLWMGTGYYFMLTEAEDIEVILGSNTHITKMRDYSYLEPWLGQGLLTSKGDTWRRSRKIITPTFHFKILEKYAEVFNKGSDILIEKLKDQADGRIIDIYRYVSLCVLDLVTESAMGVKLNAQQDPSSSIVQSIFDICYAMMQRGFSIWQRHDILFKFSDTYRIQEKALSVISAFNEKVIIQRSNALRGKNNENKDEEREEEGVETKKKVAFLDMLLTATIDGKNLPDKMIRDEVATFTFEGHDTTSSAIAFGLYSFANNPETQQKAYEEQIEIFGNDKNRHPTYKDFQNMKYLDRCIKEILRLYPSVPLIGRLAEEDIDINGKIVAAGTNIVILVYALHRNPKYYPDPEKFDPDRFLLENRANKNPYEYVPFSAGARNCIGQKFAGLLMKAIYSKLLRNYEFLSAGPDLDPIIYVEVTLKSKNGLSVKLAHRK